MLYLIIAQQRLLLVLVLSLLVPMTVSYLQTPVGAGAAFTAAPSLRHSSRRIVSNCLQATPRAEAAQQQQQQPQQVPQQQHLVLIGGGHSHVQVIRALNAAARPPHVRVTLIDAKASASYSGMVPGCIAGLYSPTDTLLHLEPLAAWAGIRFVRDTVVDVDFDRKQIFLLNNNNNNNNHHEEQAVIPFDVVSIDIGSTSRGYDSCPGAAKYAIPTRPIEQLIYKLDAARRAQLLDDDDDDDDVTRTRRKQRPKLVVIGGGTAGIELAMAVTSRWNKDGLTFGECTVLDAGDQLLPSESALARETVRAVLQSKNIAVRHGCQVTKVGKKVIHLANTNNSNGDSTIPYTHCVWATGAGAHRLAWHLAQVRGLDCDDLGWIRVQPTLQSTSHPFVFAAGDCASIQHLERGPPPKAGVYAVRAGPILIENLTRYLDSIRDNAEDPARGESPSSNNVKLLPYVPQDDFLKLLVCGDGTALGFRFGLVLQGKWVFDLKDNIDQSFMKLFDVTDLPKPVAGKKEGKYDTRQYDADEPTPLLEPEEAALLLQRTDDGVDFQQAKLVLRAMGNDASYREAVLGRIRQHKVSVLVDGL